MIFIEVFLCKIAIASLCEYSSMLTNSIIGVDRYYNYSLNVIILLGPITCFQVDTIMLYILMVIIAKTTKSDCFWSRNGIHEWSAKSNLYAFFSELSQTIFGSFE